MDTCVVWRRFGPYHIARLAAAAKLFASRDAVLTGVEVAAHGGTHPWPAGDHAAAHYKTLFADATADSLSRTRIYVATRRFLEHARPDAVAVPAYSTPEAQGALAWARERGRTAVVMSDSTQHDATRIHVREHAKRAIVSRFDSALVAGAPQARYIVTLGIPRDRVFYPYDVVDNALYAPREEAGASELETGGMSESGTGRDPRRFFLASGRFIGRKNFHGLIEGYARYRNLSTPEKVWDLVILGDGPELGRLVADVRRLDLQGSVTLPGYATVAETATYYARASAFVHPATVDQWGLVVNEAMAAGLAIAVSRTAGCAEDLVKEGSNGFRFDPHNSGSIAAALERLAAPSTDLARMAAASREIISHWTVDDFAEALWNAVAAGVRSPSRGLPWTVRALLWANNVAPPSLLQWKSAET